MEAQPSIDIGASEREVREKEENARVSSSPTGFGAGFFARLGVFRAPILKTCVVSLGLFSVAMLGRAEEKSGVVQARSESGEAAPKVALPQQSETKESSPEAVPPRGTPPPCASGASEAPKDDGGKVDINAATESELRKLPGVGEKKAKAIVALRERLGRFKKPADLLRVKGIGPKMLKRMTEKIVIGEPVKTTP